MTDKKCDHHIAAFSEPAFRAALVDCQDLGKLNFARHPCILQVLSVFSTVTEKYAAMHQQLHTLEVAHVDTKREKEYAEKLLAKLMTIVSDMPGGDAVLDKFQQIEIYESVARLGVPVHAVLPVTKA